MAAFVAAAQEDSSHYRACAQAGEVQYEQGRYREAAAQFFAAIRVNKSYSRAWYGLGKTHRMLGDRSAALEALRQFLHYWPQRDERALEVGRWIEELERVE